MPSVNDLLSLYNLIRPRLEKHLPRQVIAYRREKLDKATEEKLKHTIEWLKAFIEVRVSKVEEVERLIPIEQWQNYANMGVTSGPWEVNQMAEALQAMKEDWRTRPSLLRKSGPIFEKGMVKGAKKRKPTV